MREWAKRNGLEEIYSDFLEECEEIAQECEAEGYPSHGSNYELRVAELEKCYPELFGEEDDLFAGYDHIGDDEVIG